MTTRTMVSFEEAAALTAGEARPLEVLATPLAAAAGLVLAQAVRAASDFPAQATSAMDGYAVGGGVSGRVRLRVAGASYPGRRFEDAVGPGECVRIFTGAALPASTARVVIQEEVAREGDDALMQVNSGEETFVRPPGSDFREGETLVQAGEVLTPQRLVAAAAADLACVQAWRRPKLWIIATGDELAAPGTAHATPGAIPESVSLGVAALGARWGAELAGASRLADELHLLRAAAVDALAAADLVVVCGGASVGEKDFAREMFDGLELVFSKAAIKPGKPVWLGRAGGKRVLGLPGNPTSAMVTARLFLAPLVAGLCGRDPGEAWDWREAPLAAALGATARRETFYRARRTPEGLAPLLDQTSGAQKALGQSDVLIRRMADAPAVAQGAMVQALEL